MLNLEAKINTFLERFFHLPTFIVLALISVVIAWQLYDVGFDLGDGFIRIYSNRGNINLIWLDGCCELDW